MQIASAVSLFWFFQNDTRAKAFRLNRRGKIVLTFIYEVSSFTEKKSCMRVPKKDTEIVYLGANLA